MQRITTNKKILHPELSYAIVGIAFEVQNELGRFAREKQYADLFETKLKSANIKYYREYRIGDTGNILDFLIEGEGQILIEFKAVRFLNRDHFRQMQNYLQQTRVELGLLINFSENVLKPRRVLLIK